MPFPLPPRVVQTARRLLWVAALAGLMPQGRSIAAEGPKVALKLFAEGFTSPLVLAELPDKDASFLVLDQPGLLHRVSHSGKLSPQPFLDLRDRMIQVRPAFEERGALGLALHPGFKTNGRFFVTYNAKLRSSAPQDWDSTLIVAEFRAAGPDFLAADPASEKIILQIDKPAFNHNGGCLAFGPDGFLYISVGDGGEGNDVGKGHGPNGNGQDTSVLLGKILRLDVDHGAPYSVPQDNPFVKSGGRPEIYAYGLRNPWRISFDRGGSHELFAADVGQGLFEEVDIITKGGNYGWRLREGFHGFDPQNSNKVPDATPRVAADGTPLQDPAFEYKNLNGFRKDADAYGISITGGFVYRGKAIPELQGKYVFGDWSRNFVLPDGTVLVASRPPDGRGPWAVGPLDLASHRKGALKAFVISVGQDAEGELYFMTNASNQASGKSGRIWKLVPAE